MFGLGPSEFLMLVLTAVLAGAALLTASLTKEVVQATKKMVQASVIIQIRQQLDQLNAFDRKVAPRAFDLEAISVIRADDNEADIYKEMVRKYYGAFYSVMCFSKIKTIDEKIINDIISPFEREVFLKIIKPLEEQLNALTDHSAFEFWENFFKTHAKV